MPKQFEYLQGTPNWVELKTSDPSALDANQVAGAGASGVWRWEAET